MLKKPFLLLAALASAAVLAGCCSSGDSTAVYVNGKVYTADAEQPAATAFVVKNGKFVYVGDDEGALKYGKGSDLQGKRVIPGMVDSHCHPVLVAGIDALGTITVPSNLDLHQTLAFLKEKAAGKDYKDRAFIFGFGFGIKCHPNLAVDLDKAIPDRPAAILGADGHSMWLNTKAMEMAKLTKDTPDPIPGGSYFERDADGNPTGYVVEVTAEFKLLRELGVVRSKHVVEGMPAVQSVFVRNGITAVFEAGFGAIPERVGLEALRELEKRDQLTMRFFTSYFYFGRHLDSPQNMLKTMKANNREFNTDLLRADTLKMIGDGTLEVQTAWMHRNFLAPAKGGGAPLLTMEDMLPAGKLAAAEGFNIHNHAIGDRAITEALDLDEKLGKIKGTKTICHGQVMPPGGVQRFIGQKDVFYQTTPCWIEADEYTENVLGRERYLAQMPLGALVRGGVLITFGSDFPASDGPIGVNAFFNMWYAVNRGVDASIAPPRAEAVTVKDCIDAYTINGAKQLGAADRIGSITAGKSADFVICSEDPLTINPDRLKEVKVDATYFRGRNVFRR